MVKPSHGSVIIIASLGIFEAYLLLVLTLLTGTNQVKGVQAEIKRGCGRDYSDTTKVARSFQMKMQVTRSRMQGRAPPHVQVHDTRNPCFCCHHENTAYWGGTSFRDNQSRKR